MKQDKRQIRLSFGQKRNALSETEVRLRSEKICDMLQQQYWFQKAEKICFYYPLGKLVNLCYLQKVH